MTGTPIATAVGGYRPYLDGLRSICILFTIANHVQGASWWVNGSVGVDIFFALSGWLITWLLLAERGRTGRIDLRAFYIRRAFRIVPLYLLILLLYGVIATRMGGGDRATEYWQSLPYMLTFTMEYRPDTIGSMFQPAWTLGIEEKFYLLWPATLVAAGLRYRLAWLAGLGGVTALFVTFGTSAFVIRGYVGLGLGSSAALLFWHCPRLTRHVAGAPYTLLGYLAVLCCYAGSLLQPHPWAWNVSIAAAATVAIAGSWLNPDQAVDRFLAMPWLAWLGTLTYAIYLIQSLAIAVVERLFERFGLIPEGIAVYLAAYAACVALAVPLHYGLERPLIDRGRRLARRWARCAD
ncbi:acyltransferase family protein [Sphingomonas sp. Leaf25]|uniref:acyltransferase family protein n=1 Tax=Sphingomonas sp. Leaf25 TaxID=1735692 RepID=UPI0006FDD082|nr:acyltransferase [Sphingomonas sp. Leaf25]KQN07349.1 hypothetical protein ASE78_14215 [Sphingomonas sp. Leaf25]